jgi:hypothetical protein
MLENNEAQPENAKEVKEVKEVKTKSYSCTPRPTNGSTQKG